MTVFVFTGTGTGIGKTHLCVALLLALRARGRTARGWKPLESGVQGRVGDDQQRLHAASAVGTQVPGEEHVALPEPLSPHLAAERAGRSLPWDTWMQYTLTCKDPDADTVVELAGGLFSPISVTETNVHLACLFASHFAPIVLCAPDRLGVLHEVRATIEAAQANALTVHAVCLIAPETPDLSTGTNARELGRTLPNERGQRPHIFGTLPRGTPEDLSKTEVVENILRLRVPQSA